MAQGAETGSSRDRVVVYSPEAENDHLAIYTYTAQLWGERQALSYSDFLLSIAQELANHPLTAPLVPTLTGVRCYIATWKNARQGHRIFFEETAYGINVIRILHTARDWQDHLEAWSQ